MYTIKKFEPKDMFSVIKLASDTLTEKYNPNIFTYFYETYPQGFLTAKMGHKIIGFLVGIKIDDKKAKILMISISEYQQRKKLGTALLREFEKTVKKENVNEIYLEVRTKNKKAIKFYQRHGYQIIDKINDYYQNSENAYIMKKLLSSKLSN